MEMPTHKGWTPTTPGRGDPASPRDDETLWSNMGQGSCRSRSSHVNRAKVFGKAKAANSDKRIVTAYKIARSFLLGCQAKEDEGTSKELKCRASIEFPANNQCISSLWPAKMWQRSWTASPSREKKKKTQDFQLPGDFSCWKPQIPINVYRGSAFSRCTTGDLKGKFPIKTKVFQLKLKLHK